MLNTIRKNPLTSFVGTHYKTIICVVAALVVIIALVGFYRNYRREGFQNDTLASFKLFYVDWCPHCKTTKPEFENCSKQSIKFESINCESEENADLIKGYDIEGYPTLIFEKDGNKIPYDGERSTEAMEAFLDEQM